ncbi:MAG TPA: sigma factor-like helix-turn-helix DNA-binding protein [Solirubrobacteraceae bacterium]|jgi:hypothetical protein
MDELREFCVRMLGDGEAAQQAAARAEQASGTDRVSALAGAVAACRRAGTGGETDRQADREPDPAPDPDLGLADAVASELAATTARLPQRQREALALRERFGLSHEEVAAAIGIEPTAVAALLARARLRLRSELRGAAPPAVDCAERDRALRTIGLRQDGEDVPQADDDWLLDHLGHCTGCAQAHAAMLEASACYRAWRVPEPEPASR